MSALPIMGELFAETVEQAMLADLLGADL